MKQRRARWLWPASTWSGVTLGWQTTHKPTESWTGRANRGPSRGTLTRTGGSCSAPGWSDDRATQLAQARSSCLPGYLDDQWVARGRSRPDVLEPPVTSPQPSNTRRTSPRAVGGSGREERSAPRSSGALQRRAQSRGTGKGLEARGRAPHDRRRWARGGGTTTAPTASSAPASSAAPAHVCWR